MPVVRLREPLKRLAGNCSEHTLAAATVGDLLHELEATQPSLSGWILDERGLIRPHINVFVNGELGDGRSALQDGDRVDVIPAISGGCDAASERPPSISGGRDAASERPPSMSSEGPR
jgi:molybdopterin converting factor small subunit